METINIERTIVQIREQLAQYLKQYPIQALVIGQSGGIDSALCTVLAQPVCQKLNVKLIGRSITIESNKPEEVERGQNIGNYFCTDYKEVNLTNSYIALRDAVEEPAQEDLMQEKIRRGNIKARIRMIYLYNLAQQNKGMVLSTDNYTEFLEGFWTLHGDVGDFGMIQELWKTEVYALAQWIVDNELKHESEKKALQACIDAVPTDGLGITNSDLDQLGVGTYQEVDTILYNYLHTGNGVENTVIARYKNTEFKRNNPYNLKRTDIVNVEKEKLQQTQ